MTTLADRPETGLLVVDVQDGVVADAHKRDAVVARISTLVDRARDHGTPVVWVLHSDEHLLKTSQAWESVPELRRNGTESSVNKMFGDSFEGTDLEAVLARAGIGHLKLVLAEPRGARADRRRRPDEGRDLRHVT